MSDDPSRTALLRVAREIGMEVQRNPNHLATEVIRHIHRQNASISALESALETANKRLEIMEGAESK
ncbi:MAG TPA: hypothetical protein PKY05_14585 [Fibrobacteria bacterium]|nr:hypothetical protein [Fibrobacteria bacterium]